MKNLVVFFYTLCQKRRQSFELFDKFFIWLVLIVKSQMSVWYLMTFCKQLELMWILVKKKHNLKICNVRNVDVVATKTNVSTDFNEVDEPLFSYFSFFVFVSEKRSFPEKMRRAFWIIYINSFRSKFCVRSLADSYIFVVLPFSIMFANFKLSRVWSI